MSVKQKARFAKKYADQIMKAKVAYYTTQKEIMTDLEYDRLEKQLEVWCPQHPVLQMVGYDINGNYKKLSLKETEELFNESELQETE